MPQGGLIRSYQRLRGLAQSGRVATGIAISAAHLEGDICVDWPISSGAKTVAPKSAKYVELINPATGEPFAETPVSDESDIDAALQVAAKAFQTWKRTTPAERSLAILKIADIFEAHADELVAVEAENCGKIIGVTKDFEIPR